MLHDTARWWLAVVLLAGAALRLTLVLAQPFDAGVDERYRYGAERTLYRTNTVPRYGRDTPHHFVVKPMLGYRLNALVAHAVPGTLPLFVKLRFGATLISLVTILLAYLACRNLWPEYPLRAAVLATLLAFHPKFLGLGAYLNADAYTAGASALVFYVLTIIHRRGGLQPRTAGLLGISLGLVFLGRDNGYATFVLAAGYAGYLLWQNGRPNGRMLVVSFAVWLIFPTVFYLHQYFTYGMAFIPVLVGSGSSWVPPGLSVEEAYRQLPVGGAEYPIVHLDWRNPVHWVGFLGQVSFSSFNTYSYYIAFPPLFLSAYLFFLFCGAVGLVRCLRHAPAGETLEARSRRWLLAAAGAACVALFSAVVRHNFTVLHQPDGRYLMPLVVPGLLLAVLGWRFAVREHALNSLLAAGGIGFFIFSGVYSVWMITRLYV